MTDDYSDFMNGLSSPLKEATALPSSGTAVRDLGARAFCDRRALDFGAAKGSGYDVILGSLPEMTSALHASHEMATGTVVNELGGLS